MSRRRTAKEIFEEFHASQNIQRIDEWISELKATDTESSLACAGILQGWKEINRGNHDLAIEIANRSQEVFTDLNEPEFLARSIHTKGVAYFYSGRIPEAFEQWNRILSVIENTDLPAIRASVDLHIGNVYSATGDKQKALQFWERAADAYLSVDDHMGASICYQNIGDALQIEGRVEESIEPLMRSIDLSKRSNPLNTGTVALVRLALGYARMDDLDTAERYLAMVSDQDQKMMLTHLTYLFTQGAIAERRGDLEKAVELQEVALQKAIETGYTTVQLHTLSSLRELSLKRNDLQNYVAYNQQFTELEGRTAGKEASVRIAMQEKELEMERERMEREQERALLYGALPVSVANRMLRGEDVSGDHYESVSVIFLDIVNFTALSDKIPPGHVVFLLEQIFSALDDVCTQHDVTKIKTIGDSYMAVAGVPEPLEDHAQRAASCAVDMLHTIEVLEVTMPPELGDTSWVQDVGEITVRIGIHCGPVTAGVIGKQRLQYDVWGDTVNVASRMESTGEAGRIQVSSAFAQQLQLAVAVAEEEATADSRRQQPTATANSQSQLLERGEIEIKGKGPMTTYWLEGASS